MNAVAKKETPRKRFWKEFFDLYRQRFELWKHGCEEYKNKDLRYEGYLVLLKKYHEIEADADVHALKRKLNTFRSNYRREQRKIRDSAKLVNTPKDIYVPTLWYYEYLNFLNEKDIKFEEKSICSASYDHADFLSESDDCKQHVLNEADDEEVDEMYSENGDALEGAQCRTKETIRGGGRDMSVDEAEIHSRSWAIEYRKLSPQQRLLAKHKIDEILYRGRLGALTMEKLN